MPNLLFNNNRQPARTASWSVGQTALGCFRHGLGPLHPGHPSQSDRAVPLRRWTAKLTAETPRGRCFLAGATGHLTTEAAMLRNLDLLDLFLLAGSLVYFGLLLLRRI